MQEWCRCTIYAILKEKLYNFTTNTLKAYLSAQSFSLSAFMISNNHISAQQSRGRQLNAKVCSSEKAIFLILLSFLLRPQSSTKNGSSTHCHFITKLMLITAQIFTTTQRLHSYEFTLVDKTVLLNFSSAWLPSVVQDAIL